jgi:branched-chain amino acid aminotransferase
MSPCTIRILTPDGLKPVDYHAESLNEAATYEPDDGVYTVASTVNTYQVLKLSAHLDRLADSAARAQIPLNLDRPRLRAALRELIAITNYGDVRFRITVSRDQPDAFILSAEPFTPLSADFIARGAKVITAPDSARSNAAAKTTGWMHRRRALADAMPSDTYDTILLNSDGFLMEGLGSNFYAVLNGELRTAGSGALPGIAQQIVFAVAPPIIAVRKDAIHVRDIPRLEEAFITSSSRGIVPVVAIDGHTLGDGTPGPVTRALRSAYQMWAANYLEDL